MEGMKNSNLVAALTLALCVATSWEEDDRKNPGAKYTKAWRSLHLEILESLEQHGFIRASIASRSMQITDRGVKVGGALVTQFLETFERFRE